MALPPKAEKPKHADGHARANLGGAAHAHAAPPPGFASPYLAELKRRHKEANLPGWPAGAVMYPPDDPRWKEFQALLRVGMGKMRALVEVRIDKKTWEKCSSYANQAWERYCAAVDADQEPDELDAYWVKWKLDIEAAAQGPEKLALTTLYNATKKGSETAADKILTRVYRRRYSDRIEIEASVDNAKPDFTGWTTEQIETHRKFVEASRKARLMKRG